MDLLRQLFGSGDFQPHGFCHLWNARLVWLHAISDLLIALAYLTIPLTLVWFIRKRLSGPQIYSRICEMKPDVSVIFATGYSADIASLQKAQQKGLPVLQKPYSPRNLARKVRDTLDQPRVPGTQEKPYASPQSTVIHHD